MSAEQQQPPGVSTRRGRAWLAWDVEKAGGELKAEVWRAVEVPAFNSAHEALAKVREEYLEFEDEVLRKKRAETNWKRRREEALHLAAVCVKFLMEFPEEE